MSGGGRVRDGVLLFDDGCRDFLQNSVEVSCYWSLARLLCSNKIYIIYIINII